MKSQCELCGRNVGGDTTARLTPRQLMGLDLKSSCPGEKRVKVATLIAVAGSIVSYDNPPGGADMSLFCVCRNCRDECFTIGNYNKSLTESERLKRLISGDD